MKSFEVTKSAGVSPESVRNALTMDSSLEQIAIVGFCASEIFHTATIEKLNFKLKHFSFDPPSRASSADESSMCNFLEQQGETIETLKLTQWVGVKVLETIFKMPRLSKLKLRLVGDVNWAEVKLPVNRTITRFQLAELRQKSPELISAVFDAMPNLKVLITEGLIDFEEAVLSRCASLHNIYINVRLTGDIIYIPHSIREKISHLRRQICYDVEDDLCEAPIHETEVPERIDVKVGIHSTKAALSNKRVEEIRFEQIVMLCRKGEYRYRLHEPNRAVKMF